MQQNDQAFLGSRGSLWTGRTLSIIAILFFALDGVMKLFKPAPVIAATVGLGFPESEIVGIGITVLICTALYVIPRTSILGAVLLTGYLGGAIASKVRVHAPPFDICFAITFAALIWGGIWLRNGRLRALLPLQVCLGSAPPSFRHPGAGQGGGLEARSQVSLRPKSGIPT